MDDPTAWFLTHAERKNQRTRLDDAHPDAWSEGNLVRPLVHGSTYFRELHDRIEETVPGDLILFTDWQGSADERLTGEPGSEVLEVLARADERGVDVRGLIWRSHWDKLGFFASENRTLGEHLQDCGAEALLDMRVRTGGSHHQKFVVIRHRADPGRDVAFVGGIDLAHNRRDDARHLGDPQSDLLTKEYGEHPPWHDVQAAIHGPAVHDVETVFRERWEDPTALSRHPAYWLPAKLRGEDLTPDPLPEQASPPPPAGSQAVQLLRTYPNLRHGRDYPFAPGGERSVALGYAKAIRRARELVYVEDQYLWGDDVAGPFADALRANPGLHVVAVVPLVPDLGGLSRSPQLLGRERAVRQMHEAGPGRVAVYGVENHQGTPVYVHAKVCVVDDAWATIGSDNFNRRSWTHDSELSAAVVDRDGDYARTLRLTLAAEHLDRLDAVSGDNLTEVMSDCLTGRGLYETYAASAARLQAWHDGGRAGERPPGRLRPLAEPRLSALIRLVSRPSLAVLQDPDGRPRPLRRTARY